MTMKESIIIIFVEFKNTDDTIPIYKHLNI
jgi:hypothetical protein